MKKLLFFIGFLSAFAGCVSDAGFSVPDIVCEEAELHITHTIVQVKAMAGYGIATFDSEIIMVGYVVSSDASGNIYKSISIQDRPKDPTAAITFSVDKTNLYSVFPVGRKVYVMLKGLSIGYSRGALVVGKAVGSELERIPNTEVFHHFIRSCEFEELEPISISVDQIDESYLGELVQFNNVQFRNEDIGKTYGELNSTKTIDRVLEETSNDCELNGRINVSISGFSDFKNRELPSGKGEVVGLLTKYYSEYQLILRSEEDVILDKERCGLVTSNDATISFSEIIEMYDNKVLEFGTDKEYVFEGYINSSDQEGNFIHTVFVQDQLKDPMGGFKILIDKENLFESFQVGDKVLLKLNHLYLDNVDGVYTIGVFKDDSIGEIHEDELANYIFNSGENYELTPQEFDLEELSINSSQNTLVSISSVQVRENELGKAFAYYSGDENGNRNLETCGMLQRLELETLGTASFANTKFPEGKGIVTGVLYRENAKWKIQMRSIKDISFNKDRESCLEIVSKIVITEVADPENNVGARFVELYNAGETDVLLEGWQLNKYLNGSNTLSANGLDLSGLVIPSKGFVILANTSFDSVFLQRADLVSSYISGNGDDVYELVDNNGVIHDVFGVKGEDGTGTFWEYLDGKAVRKLDIGSPSKVFTISEWEIFTKASGNKQLAPENFSPWEY